MSSINFLTPLQRTTGSATQLTLQLSIVNSIDWIFSFPLTRYYHQATYDTTRGNKKIYRLSTLPFSYQPLTLQGVKIALIAAFFWKFPRATSLVLFAGFSLKYWIRLSEQYLLPSAQQNMTSNSIQRLVPTPEENLKKWVQRWQCEIYFYLFLMGVKEQAGQSPTAGETISIKIGNEEKSYDKRLMSQIPYFEAFLRWHPGENICLSETFPLSHEKLAKIQDLLFENDIQKWDLEALEDFGFLLIDQRRGQGKLFSRLAYLQEILSEPLTIDAIQGGETLSRNPPSCKCPTFSMDLFPLSHLPKMTHKETVEYLKEVTNSIELSINEKHYYFNRIMNDYINELHQEINKTIIANLRQEPILQTVIPAPIDLIGAVLKIIEEVPQTAQFLTILCLPSNTNYSKIDELLRLLPHILWLQCDIFKELISTDQLPQLNDVRVFSINGQFMDREVLKTKFPNADIIEIN